MHLCFVSIEKNPHAISGPPIELYTSAFGYKTLLAPHLSLNKNHNCNLPIIFLTLCKYSTVIFRESQGKEMITLQYMYIMHGYTSPALYNTFLSIADWKNPFMVAMHAGRQAVSESYKILSSV